MFLRLTTTLHSALHRVYLCLMTTRQWLTFALCWCAGLASGSIATLVPTFLPSITATLAPTAPLEETAQIGAFLQSVFLVGWVTGGVVLGLFADLRGRLPVLAIALSIAVLGAASLPLAPSPALAYIVRFITGIGVGSTMVISTTLGAEVLSHGRRPVFMGLLANSYAFGIVFLGGLQSTDMLWSDASFVMLSFALLVPAVGSLSTKPVATTMRHESEPTERLASALRQSRRDLIIGSLLFGCMLITLWASFSWLPTWATALFPGSDSGAGLRGSIMVSLGIGGIVGSIFSGVIARRIGRVKTVVVCYSGALIGCLALYSSAPSTPGTMMFLVSALAVFFGMCQGMMAFYIPELFPPRIRATSVGVCFNAGRLITAGAVLNVGFLAVTLGGYQEALLVFTAPLAIGLTITWFAREPHPALQSPTI